MTMTKGTIKILQNSKDKDKYKTKTIKKLNKTKNVIIISINETYDHIIISYQVN
jgi:prophage antirepressor-like protein